MKTLLLGVVCFPLLLAIPADADKRVTINIKDLKNDEKVQEVTNVSGRVSDPRAQVWLVVKPQHASDCWIQTAAAVGNDGKWMVEAHFGDRNTHSESFDIIAIANPDNDKTHEGKTKCWPGAASRSAVIHVRRE